MNTQSFYKSRLFWILLVLFISLTLVGAALASASQLGRSVTEGQTAPPQTQRSNQPVASSPGLTNQAAYVAPVSRPPADQTAEAMRQQAMVMSQAEQTADIEIKSGAGDSSLAPQGAGTTYLPGGIVIDTYLDTIYGNVSPYASVDINAIDAYAYGYAEADEVGFFWLNVFDKGLQGTVVDITPNSNIYLTVDGVPQYVQLSSEPFGEIDVLDNVISGTIPFVYNTQVTATIGLYGEPSTAYGIYTAMTDANGSFSISLSQDVGPENFASIDYKVSGVTQRSYFFPGNTFLVYQNSHLSGYAPRYTDVVAASYSPAHELRDRQSIWVEYPYGWYTIPTLAMAPGDTIVVTYTGGITSELTYIYASWFTFEGDNTVLGRTDPGTDLRVSFLGWNGAGYTYTETFATSNEFGDFVAIFAEGGIRPDTRVDIAIMDPSGSGSYMVSGPPYIQAITMVDSTNDCVNGRINVPNLGAPDLGISLIRDGVEYWRDPSRGYPPSDPGNIVGENACYVIWQDFNDGQGVRGMRFQPGDILKFTTPTEIYTVTVVTPHISAQSVGNFIEGEIASGENGQIAVKLTPSDINFIPMGVGVEGRADATPSFLIPFSGFDVRAGINLDYYFYDPVTGFANEFVERDHYIQAVGDKAVRGHSTPNEPVTLNLLLSDTLEPVYTSTTDLDPDPNNFYFDFTDCNLFPGCPNPPLQPGYTIQVTYAWHDTGDDRLDYAPVSVIADPDTQMITATGKNGMIELSGGREGYTFDHQAPTYNGTAVLNVGWFGFPLSAGDNVTMLYRDPSGNLLSNSTLGEVFRVEFWFNQPPYSGVWGNAVPNSPVRIVTSRGEELFTFSDQYGNFGTNQSAYLIPGDWITVYAGLGNSPVTVYIRDYHANSDSANDTVLGYTMLPDMQVEIYPWWNEPMTVTQTNENGYFTKQFAPNSVPGSAQGYIRFIDPTQSTNTLTTIFHRTFYDLQPTMGVNYAHDWVEGPYDPGYAVAITLTNDVGEIKATASGVTGDPGWWGGQTGFTTSSDQITPWNGPRPDIVPTDHVYVSVNGRTIELQVGEINGTMDVDLDIVQGTLNVPWLTDPVWVDCGAWVENGIGFGYDYVDPNGGTFICNFAEHGYNLKPGIDVGVQYYPPGGSRVINVFSVPTPHLYVNLETHGVPTEGGNYVFRVHYNNDGWLLAPDVTITQQFSGMTYLYDTSGFPHTGTGALGEPVTWQVGDMPYSHTGDKSFLVFAHVDGMLNDEIWTMVEINTSLDYYQGDWGSKQFKWNEIVQMNDTDLNISKGTWTWDPVPNTDFVYNVNVCNAGNANSAELFITDTLPTSTSLNFWWSQEPGWIPVTEDPQLLVVKRGSLGGPNWCGEIYLNVHLDENVPEGTELLNHAQVWTSNETNPGNNATELKTYVGRPHYNLHLNTNWIAGQFVPGGQVYYEFGVANWSNMPMPNTLLTTTLPADAQFGRAYTWDWQGQTPFTPTIIGDGYLVWKFDPLLNGYNINLGIELKISDNAQPGTPFVVENHTLGGMPEERYDDNVVTYPEMVNDFGPNLRIDKHTNWQWWYWDNAARAIYYELRVYNLGSQYIDNPVIVDSYPISTTTPSCWFNHGPWVGSSCQVNEVNHVVTYTLDYLNPGETASANLAVFLTDGYIGVEGLEFTNQVDISDFGDITPADNQDVLTVYTSPDVFVRKTLKQADLTPGGLITYTVEFGNSTRWPWDGDPNFGSHITDTIPAGTSFVTAIPYWDRQNAWPPEFINGDEVVWKWGTMWAEGLWTFDLVVQIDEDIPLGQPLLNTIEAWGDNPADFEADPSDNTAVLPLVDNPGAFGKVAPADGAVGVPKDTTLSWDASDMAGAYEYCIDTTDDDLCDGSWVSTGTDTNVALTGLMMETTYYWQVRALKVGGTTDANAGTWWSFTTVIIPPAAFGKLLPADGGLALPIDIELSWESSMRAASYAYCLDTTDDDTCEGEWISVGGDTSVAISGLSYDTTYFWQVQAINAGGVTDANEGTWWSFTTIIAPPGAFGKLTPADGATGVNTAPTLSWEASTGAESYWYCYDTTDDDTCDGSWISAGTATSIELSGLSNDTTYYWQVNAMNSGGNVNADADIWWSFTTEKGVSYILLPIIQKTP